MSTGLRHREPRVCRGYSAVLEGQFKHGRVFEHAVLDSPQSALAWLDERLTHLRSQHVDTARRRHVLRSLRGDLRRRDEWRAGAPREPYVIRAQTSTVHVEGRLCPVRTLPVLAPCLLLEVTA